MEMGTKEMGMMRRERRERTLSRRIVLGELPDQLSPLLPLPLRRRAGIELACQIRRILDVKVGKPSRAVERRGVQLRLGCRHCILS